jgi:bifunctional DNA-binding transcriptional regulator/antitoxin component of YhaV-PrlF toxin-antitoxin module
MTAQPVAPVIPPAGRPGRYRQGRLSAARPLPLASTPERSDAVYGFGRIDASGRVADRAIISALGWHAGDRLTFTAAAGVVIARRDPDGMIAMPARPCVAIPAALRRRCGLRPGDRVLLAVIPCEDALAAYSFAVVDQAIRAHGALPCGEGGQR